MENNISNCCGAKTEWRGLEVRGTQTLYCTKCGEPCFFHPAIKPEVPLSWKVELGIPLNSEDSGEKRFHLKECQAYQGDGCICNLVNRRKTMDAIAESYNPPAPPEDWEKDDKKWLDDFDALFPYRIPEQIGEPWNPLSISNMDLRRVIKAFIKEKKTQWEQEVIERANLGRLREKDWQKMAKDWYWTFEDVNGDFDGLLRIYTVQNGAKIAEVDLRKFFQQPLVVDRIENKAAAEARKKTIEEDIETIKSKHVRAKSAFHGDSWDSGYHEALHEAEKSLVAKLKELK